MCRERCQQTRFGLLNVIHVRDSSVGLGVLTEANETKATAAAGVTVLDDDLHTLTKARWVEGEGAHTAS